jgi:tRNA-2-methylthio-N6-dimethylallyladenosine synthase
MIRDLIPEVCISTDIITGFCTETEIDHQLTLDLMESVRFDLAYMFFYSERKGTYAAKHFKDDIPLSVKKRRLNEIITLQSLHSLESNKKDVDKTFEILIEGISKKSSLQQKGRNSQNKMVVFQYEDKSIGDYVKVKITDCTSATLIGETEKDKIE